MSDDIEMKPVESTNISKVGYDPATKTLAVAFADGSLYHYQNVEPSAHDDLLAAKSMGSHLHKNIKGAYKYAKK